MHKIYFPPFDRINPQYSTFTAPGGSNIHYQFKKGTSDLAQGIWNLIKVF